MNTNYVEVALAWVPISSAQSLWLDMQGLWTNANHALDHDISKQNWTLVMLNDWELWVIRCFKGVRNLYFQRFHCFEILHFQEKMFLREFSSLRVNPFINYLLFTANCLARNYLLPEVEGHTALALAQTFNAIRQFKWVTTDLTFVFNSPSNESTFNVCIFQSLKGIWSLNFRFRSILHVLLCIELKLI